MTEFSQFKTCKKYRFSNRNAPNDADIVEVFFVGKIPTFTAQEPFCRFTRVSFLPRNLTAALPCSLPTVRSSHSHIPFGRSFSFQSTTEVICHDRKFDLSAERKIKSRHISTLIIGESFALASNQMLICDGFELFKRPYCLRRLNSTLNSTKNNGGESRYAPKGEYRRYSGLVPDYTSTKTSYSVVAPRLKGIILYHKAYRKSRILRCIFNTFRILDENNLFQNKKYLILRTDFRILCVIFIAIFFFMCYNKSEHICAFSVREFYD